MGVGAIVATIAPGLVVFALPAIGLIARNREFFQGDFAAGRDLYVLSLLVVAFGFGLWAISRWRVGRFLWTCYVLTTPAWFVYTVAGNWDRAVAATVVTLSVLAIAVAAERGPALIRGIELVSVVLLLGLITTTLLDATSTAAESTGSSGRRLPLGATNDDSAQENSGTASSSTPNIYHVVMDEYQTEMFELTFNADLEKTLSGFIYYPHARTTFGRTEMSMASTLGASDYDYRATPQDFVEDSLRGPTSNLNTLRRAGYRTVGFSHLASLYGSPSPFDESIILKDFIEVDPGADSKVLVNSLWLYANTPTGVARLLLPEDDFSAFAGENLLPDDAPPLSAWSLQKFIALERNYRTSGRYTLIHLILPHFPYVLSADCVYVEGRETSPLEQAACANHLITALVDELQRLDRFDDSVIVIQGDHGARFQTQGDELRQLPQDFAGEAWNDARSKSLLLVKPVGGSANDPLVVSDYPARLADIMPTVFDSVGVAYVPKDGRTSLLAKQLPDRSTRYYHFYDKGDDGLPDGELTRFVIERDELHFDSIIKLPPP